MDWLYIAVVLVFFGLSWAFVKFCQSMMGGEQ
jgi:hypothetical protein